MSIKLLIADDEDMVRNGIAKYIRMHTDRFEKIFLAENGDEALELIFLHRPDIMLMDVQMPKRTGLEVMKESMKADVLPATIILSGYDEFTYAQQGIRYGARDYLLKPCRSSDILKRLEDLADELYGKEEKDHLLEEDPSNHLVASSVEYINENYQKNMSLDEVANQIGITSGYLSTLFTKHKECTFIDYLNQIRIDHACTYLKQKYLKTYEIAYKVGFRDEKYFSKVFKKIKGVSPAQYRKSS